MQQLAPLFFSEHNDLSWEYLTTFNFSGFADMVKGEGPLVWSMIDQLGYSKSQHQRNIQKNPHMVCTHINGATCL